MMNKIILSILFLIGLSQADSFERALKFVLAHEGGYCITYHNQDTIEYNYGLSSKYFGDVKNLSLNQAKKIYKKIWDDANCSAITDSNLALVYFDSYIMFSPATASSLMASCGYDWKVFLFHRLDKHLYYIKKYPYMKELYLYSWMIRINDLYLEATNPY